MQPVMTGMDAVVVESVVPTGMRSSAVESRRAIGMGQTRIDRT
jgi:hypothetical protein